MADSSASPAADADLDSAGRAGAAARDGELIGLLTRRRVASGLSQAGVAKLMGTSQPAVARLESGRHDVQLSTVNRYAGALGLSLGLVEEEETQAGHRGAGSEDETAEASAGRQAFLEQGPHRAPAPADTGPGGRPAQNPEGGALAALAEMPDRLDPGHGLTSRQRKVLDVIRDALQRRGYPPSLREIGEAVGLTSASSVSYQLSTLQKKGYLRRDAGRARSVEVHLPEHPAARSGGEGDEDAATGIRSRDTARVPLLGKMTAGGLALADQGIEVYSLPRQIVGDGSLFLHQMADDSMNGAGIKDGDWVVVRRGPDAGEGDTVAVIAGGQAIVRVFRRVSGDVMLMPHNASFPPLPGNGVRILGQVVALLRQLP